MGTYVPTLLPMNFCLPPLLPRPPCFSESLHHSEFSSFIVSPSCFNNHQNMRMHHPRHLKNKTKFSLTFSSSSYICSSSSSSVKIGIGAIISAIFQPRNYRSFDSFFSCLSQLSQQLLQRHHAIIISISEPLLLYVTWLKFAFKGTIPEQHLCSNFLSQLCITRHLK